MVYTIGQFAGLHQVSKKTLRYYRDIGLLEPADIDPVNGYAFYEGEQFERMRRIQYLRRLRFSLEEIRLLLDIQPDLWNDHVQARLGDIRSERRLLSSIEQELLALQSRICNGKEKQQVIDQLISNFFGNEEPERISHQYVATKCFGLVCECEKDMSMGTYMLGMQVTNLIEIPEGMRSFTLPVGLYARVTFQARDRETLTNSALEGAYDYLYNNWLPESRYMMVDMLAAEVYREEQMEMPVQPEMELWQWVRPK